MEIIAKSGASTEGYRIFDTKFDEVIAAADLCDPQELDRLRVMLDRHMENVTSIVGKLANRLQRKLMAHQNRSWDFDLEEGVLDAAKLHRVVTQPLSPLSYKQEQDTKFRDTVVTLLLDNSGSMRGRPITIAAVTAIFWHARLNVAASKSKFLALPPVHGKVGNRANYGNRPESQPCQGA